MTEPHQASAFRRAADTSWRFLVIAAALLVILAALVHLRLVVLPVIGALFLSVLLVPLVMFLKDHGWPPLLATWTVIVTLLGLGALFVTLTGPVIVDQLDDFGTSLREGLDQALQWAAEGPLDLSEQDIDRIVDDAAAQLSANRSQIATGVVTGASLLFEIVAGFLLMMVITFFFMKDGEDIQRWLLDITPEQRRADARELGRRAWMTLGGYLRGVAIVGFVEAVLIGIVLVVVGVPLVVPLMVLTFFGAFFPLIGATLAGIVAALIALVSGGVVDALIVAAAILVIQQVEGDVLQPVVMGRTVNLHPVVILLALTAGAVLGGIVGAFLAVPITAIAASWSGYLRSKNAAA